MEHYKPIRIECELIAGLLPAMKAMRLPKKSKSDSSVDVLGDGDAKLAGNLILAGNDHAKALRGIIVWVRMEMQVGFMIEQETYRIGAEILSTSSSMHGELKELSGVDLAEQKQVDLADKVYVRREHFSYQCLRSIYKARKSHRHPDWAIFCAFIEDLPHFDKLICPKFDSLKSVKHREIYKEVIEYMEEG